MLEIRLTRRASLLLPFLLAACGGETPPQSFPPLRYNYLPPIRLNVASITVEQRFYPSNVSPNVNQQDPVSPIDALRAMAEDRLQALGTSGQAVFGITNASLTRQDDVLTCTLAVTLEIYGSPGVRTGFAEASITRQHTGPVDDLPTALYDLTKTAMDAMNVEFEFQVRSNLQQWLVPASAVPPPVTQQPLETPGTPPGSPPPGAPPSAPPPGAPPSGALPPAAPPPPNGAPVAPPLGVLPAGPPPTYR